MKIVPVVEASPQFINCTPVSEVIRRKSYEISVYAGQHYNMGMSDTFFKKFGVLEPDYYLGVSSALHDCQKDEMLKKYWGSISK